MTESNNEEILSSTASTYNDLEVVIKAEIMEEEGKDVSIEEYSIDIRERSNSLNPIIDSIIKVENGSKITNESIPNHINGCVSKSVTIKNLPGKQFQRHLCKNNDEIPSSQSDMESGITFQSGLSNQKVDVKSGSRHSNDNSYKCNICEKVFGTNSNYNRHLRIHTGAKPYTCNICEKSFRDQGNLKKHLHIHTGEKPFVCQICGKSFRSGSNLNRHSRTHTGEKPFTCGECGMMFGESSSLKRHIGLHSSETPYRCKFCKTSFGDQDNLNRHLLMHTGGKTYECEICGKSFVGKAGLNKHLLAHASEKSAR